MKNLVIVLLSVGIIFILAAAYFLDNRRAPNGEVAANPNHVDEDFSTEKIFVESDGEGEIFVYVKGSKGGSNKYIGYQLNHLTKELNKEEEVSNYNLWKINGAGEYSRDVLDTFRLRTEVVRSGEWEMALWERGATDFVGGSAHGDEVMTSVQAFMDGKEISLDEAIDIETDNFEIKTISDVYRDNTITSEPEVIGEHHKIYTFNKDGLSLEQSVSFNQPVLMYRPYLTMLPILRDKDGEQITDTYTANDKEYDISTDQFEEEYMESEKATVFGKESGISATVEITDKNVNTPTIFHVANASNYNKLYFAFTRDDFQVNAGDEWKQTTLYDIDTSN